MAEIVASTRIAGVKFARLTAFVDERGRFIETFRREWFPEREWSEIQGNRSDSRKGVLRGLHYHLNQIDYWYPAMGRIRVGLVDLRRGSSTRGAVETLEVGGDDPLGIYVPVGVAHGFLALTDSTLTYVVDRYYDASDEYGVAWNDPGIGLDWGIADPLLSPRDMKNPRLDQMDSALLPA